MNKIVELDIVGLAFTGRAVAYDHGKVTFVDGGLPGEKVEAIITKSRKHHNQARMMRLLSRSPERIDPICRHYDICGGCVWQDLEYGRQLYYKRRQVLDCLEHIGKFTEAPVEEVRPSPQTFFYRNKMEFSFHVVPPEESKHGFMLGLHQRGRFDLIFDIDRCHLQSDFSNELVGLLRQKVVDLGIPAYDLRNHDGFIRFAIVREGKNTNQKLLTLVTGEGPFQYKSELVEALTGRFPELTSIVWTVNATVTNIARGEIREVLFGAGYIEEEIMGRRFRISPGSFFQTNSHQAEELYRAAIDLGATTSTGTLLDLYCGAGAIGICAASQVGRVIGVDIEPEAIAAAEVNAQINGLTNCRFYAGPAEKVLASSELKGAAFDIAVVDPPRVGMHPRALELLLKLDPPTIVYISCNPSTFARDAAVLRDAGYGLEKVIPFDMFPHTMHIELVARFTKNA